jgi:hypothetical protein
MGGDAEPVGHLGHTVTTISHLTNRLNLEFFGIVFAAHGYLSGCHFGWLKGVANWWRFSRTTGIATAVAEEKHQLLSRIS